MQTNIKLGGSRLSRRYETLPSQNELPSTSAFEFNKLFYDTFAFRDPITYKQFQYKQARQSCEPVNGIDNWNSNDKQKQKSMKNRVKEYKFTKKFELKCLQNKYLKISNKTQDKQNDMKQIEHNITLLKTKQHSIDKDRIHELNKQELGRVLSQNTHVSHQIIKINKSSILLDNFRPIKSRTHIKKWDKIQNLSHSEIDRKTGQNDIENRIRDKIINHMKYELKSNGEYLLNMSIGQKRRHLIKSQFSQSNKFKIRQYPKHAHADVSAFSCSQQLAERDFNETVVQDESKEKLKDEDVAFISLIKQGFIHQVELQLNNHPHKHAVRDENDNNIFHIAIKEGNVQVIKVLLRIIYPRSCYSLLCGKNNLKRTPREKAAMLCEHQICRLIDDFLEKYQTYVK